MKRLRLLAGLALLVLIAPVAGTAHTASAASGPLRYSIYANHYAPTTVTPHSAYLNVAGWMGRTVDNVYVSVSHGYTAGGLSYQDSANTQWWGDSDGAATGTLQITPGFASPLSIVSMDLAMSHAGWPSSHITGRGIFDNVHGRMVGGSFSITITGTIHIYRVQGGSAWLVGTRTGQMTETLHIPAEASVSVYRAEL